jgi:cyanophycin synthetase
VLNADDERVAAMADKVVGKVAYFSMDPNHPLVLSHVEAGGISAVYAQGYITILQQDWVHQIEHVERVPLTLGGRAPFMIANALAASLAAFVQGVNVDRIRTALQSFQASTAHTPGRMNLFNLGHYHVLIDYAHNPAGYAAVGSFVKNWKGTTIGVVGGPGDRRDEDLIELGKISATFFDEIIVKEDDDPRGRNPGEVAALIAFGIDLSSTNSHTIVPHTTRLNEAESIAWALDNAPDKGLVTIFVDSVSRAIDIVMSRNPIIDNPEVPVTTELQPDNSPMWEPVTPANNGKKTKQKAI